MRRILLLLFLAVPVAAQETDGVPEGAVAILPVRNLGAVLIGTPQFPPTRPRYPLGITVSAVVERMRLSDPINWSGPVQFPATAKGIAVTLDTDFLHLDAVGTTFGSTPGQRRIRAQLDVFFLHAGKSGFGVELNYWDIRSRRRSVVIVDIGIDSVHQGRLITGGLALRAAAPRNTTFNLSLTGGEIENVYDSIIETGAHSIVEHVGRDFVPVGVVHASFQTGQMLHRIRLSCDARYIRSRRTDLPLTPQSEWSGGASLDVRVLGGSRSSLLLGIAGRLGPRERTIVSDRTVGVHATLKIR